MKNLQDVIDHAQKNQPDFFEALQLGTLTTEPDAIVVTCPNKKAHRAVEHWVVELAQAAELLHLRDIVFRCPEVPKEVRAKAETVLNYALYYARVTGNENP